MSNLFAVNSPKTARFTDLDSTNQLSVSSRPAFGKQVIANRPRVDQVDEHIYEELDNYSTSQPSQPTTKVDIYDGVECHKNSLFGSKFSRTEILEYLHDARGRLEQTIKQMEDEPDDNEEDADKQMDADSLPHKARIIPDIEINDSGNSSLCFGEDTYSDTFNCFKNSPKSKLNEIVISRRNRVSNVSNASSESSATSGVSVSNDEEDTITNDSLGSNGTFSQTNYYGSGTDSLMSTIERNDSGVGNDLPCTNRSIKNDQEYGSSSSGGIDVDKQCVDCFGLLDSALLSKQQQTSRVNKSTLVCSPCVKRRNERKEIISEIVETELKYGRDLKIILEEFARPISVAGLLTQQQVDDIFLNLDELIELNCHFSANLQNYLECCLEQNDEVCSEWAQ